MKSGTFSALARSVVSMGDAPGPGRIVIEPQEPSGAALRRLDSWKAVAGYLNRGARTVQRWEREEGLPIHRLQHDKLGSIYAFCEELDAWWNSRKSTIRIEPEPEAEPEPTLAVLPFSDLSRERDQEYFCDGMAEELIIALGHLQGLKVKSRVASFRYKSSGLDVPEVGRQLGASTLLTGSVRKSGERLRIVVELVDVAQGNQLWSQTYDREFGDIFAVQEEIARNVAHTLAVTLTPKEQAALRHVPTHSPEAYDYYLRGRTFYYRYSPADVHCATQLFTNAVGCDPDYPLAYAGLADCWSFLYLNSERSAAMLEKSEAASRRAVELAPDSAQAQASRALALSLSNRNAEAEQAFTEALALDGNLFEARYFYARHCFGVGQFEKAVELYEGARRVRPEDYQAPLLVAQIYDDLGRHEEARRSRLEGIALADKHLLLNPDDARALYMAANGMAAIGQTEKARQWADRAYNLRPEDSMLLYNLGCIYSMLGHTGRALDVLEKGMRLGLRHRGWYEHDSNLDSLRAEPRFRALLAQLA